MIELVWWVWPIGIIAALLIGAGTAAAGYWLYSFIVERKLKQELPEVKKQGVKITKDAGRTSIRDEKEVQEDDRAKQDKYREFEKLRRLAATEPDPKRDTKQPRQGNVQNKTPVSDTSPDTAVSFD